MLGRFFRVLQGIISSSKSISLPDTLPALTTFPLHISPPPQPLKAPLNFRAQPPTKVIILCLIVGKKDSTRDLLQMEAITGAVIKWKNNIIMSSHKDVKSCLSKANTWLVKLGCAAAGSFWQAGWDPCSTQLKHPGAFSAIWAGNWALKLGPAGGRFIDTPRPLAWSRARGISSVHPKYPQWGDNIPGVDSGIGCLSKPNPLSPAPAVTHWGCWPQFFG